ncbi:MAG: agmatinase [Deltaproteobacteria bacterium]|nr:agmatinase [Deltaproteobacteria bacterium]
MKEVKMTGKANLAFCGIPTFCRTPQVLSLDDIESDIAILGIPFDEGVGFRPGTRFGPRSIREYSMRFPCFGSSSADRGYWDIDKRQRFLSNVRMADCGDVDIVPLDLPYVYRQIDEAMKGILNKGAFPVVLGGDHSITYPVVRAFEGMGPLSLIHLDAHLDRRESILGVKYGHGSPIRRISELDFIETIVSLGMRGLRTPEKDFLDAEKRGDVLISSRSIQQSGIENTLRQIPNLERCYVTIDIDVLDPSVAPGTGTPEADGLSYSCVKDILWGIAEKSKVVGFDLVEVNPNLDPSGRTSLIAAQLCLEFLGALFR